MLKYVSCRNAQDSFQVGEGRAVKRNSLVAGDSTTGQDDDSVTKKPLPFDVIQEDSDTKKPLPFDVTREDSDTRKPLPFDVTEEDSDTKKPLPFDITEEEQLKMRPPSSVSQVCCSSH